MPKQQDNQDGDRLRQGLERIYQHAYEVGLSGNSAALLEIDVDYFMGLIAADREAAVRAAYINELRACSDLQYITKRADRIEWVNKRLAELQADRPAAPGKEADNV